MKNFSAQKLALGASFTVVAVMALGLGGCATSANPKEMTVQAPTAATKPFSATLVHAMCVRNVTGGEKTNPLWVSKVDDAGFKAALSSSLDNAELSAKDGSCQYPIDTTLLGLSQPIAGFDMTVTAHVNYKVYKPSGDPLLLETLDTPYTANFSDALIGAMRLQKANEGAIRTSIEAFFGKLREITPALPANAKPIDEAIKADDTKPK